MQEMALDKADDDENRRHPPPLSPSGGGQGEDVEDFPRSPTQYKAIYCVRNLFKPQHILHIIQPLWLFYKPQGSPYSASCKCISGLGSMCYLQSFTKTAKNDCMVADYITCPYSLDSYLFRFSLA